MAVNPLSLCVIGMIMHGCHFINRQVVLPYIHGADKAESGRILLYENGKDQWMTCTYIGSTGVVLIIAFQAT